VTAAAADRNASPSTRALTCTGGGANGPASFGPFSLSRAWKWMIPRSWYSATLANWIERTSSSRVAAIPSRLARCLPRAVRNRCHSSLAWYCHTTWEL